ncbi:hypothetical protein [Streptomyces stelliscabiei]|uniref:Uncharacterized protein n=1 Tax=Streptomyces stelliscabiei TaxID=146820 RepID=A0A8I0TVK8_9ACTN|nr:hypothetical protein [Streptomyces stelliscabiei]MBE1601987.1 hypothetical protein [Streptomyces stelliscabiei]MDX2514205.1 hypothetical protein [Streptomyces stelliscabiei]MDX2552531.1 hypothetical protein [Streptomyces stelliscabiei]MDX2611926.1 hypothetical protein [Streptomyces stelliscabiei]MDX2637273.1 hypothetical protein [Streptomyces stelliscabiei]
MAVDAAPSGNAPSGRLRLGAATRALATAFPVAARGSHADNSAGPATAGPHSAHAGGSSAPPRPLRAGERFLDLRKAEAHPPTPPEGGGSDGHRCQMIDPGLTKTAFLTGTQFAPENAAIAHHADAYAVPAGRHYRGARAGREDPWSRLAVFRRTGVTGGRGRSRGRGVGGHLGASGNHEGAI